MRKIDTNSNCHHGERALVNSKDTLIKMGYNTKLQQGGLERNQLMNSFLVYNSIISNRINFKVFQHLHADQSYLFSFKNRMMFKALLDDLFIQQARLKEVIMFRLLCGNMGTKPGERYYANRDFSILQ